MNYQHRIDPDVQPEEVADVMADLIREGKILHWGISETTEEYLRRAHAVCPVTAIQNRYSMMARHHERLSFFKLLITPFPNNSRCPDVLVDSVTATSYFFR